MKFIVNSQQLCKQLSSISGIISNNNTVPLVNCFHFHIENNSLTVKATDLATTLTVTLPVDSASSDGLNDIAIPASLLLNILKSLNDAPAIFDVDESNFSITITSGEGQYRLAGRNAETYPELLEMKEPSSIVISASVLVSAINKTIFATSNDEESHQQLSGILLEIGNEYTTFCATDGHKLVRYRRTDITSDEETRLILPRKPINIIKGILSSNKEDLDVTVQYDSTNIAFSFGNHFAVCRLIDGKYPNYNAAIPTSSTSRMIIDRATLLNTLRRVSLFANQSTLQVRLDINPDNVIISSEDIEFANDAHEKLPCAYDGEKLEIGFSAKFLNEMLSSLDCEQINFELTTPIKPGIITPITTEGADPAEDILMLVMPVALSY